MYYFFLVAEYSCVAFSLFNLLKKISIARVGIKCLFLLIIFFGCLLFSIGLGDSDSWMAGIKFLNFCVIFIFSLWFPGKARLFLIVFLPIEMVAHFVAGDIFTKYGVIYFLLFGCLLVISVENGARARKIIFLFLLLEILQAFLLASRTSLLFCVIVLMILLLPVGRIRSFISWVALVLPPLYIVALSVFHHLLTDESSWTQILSSSASASNFERSLMAAWAVDNFNQFILYGPGEGFSDAVNAIIENRWLHATYIIDPHNFLLSVWVWLGGMVMFMGYFLWCRIFNFSKYKIHDFSNAAIKYYAILACFAVVLFITAPPSAAYRLKVALVLGVAVAGLRRPNILMRPKMNGKLD